LKPSERQKILFIITQLIMKHMLQYKSYGIKKDTIIFK